MRPSRPPIVSIRFVRQTCRKHSIRTIAGWAFRPSTSHRTTIGWPPFSGYDVCYTNRKGQILGVSIGDGRVAQLVRPGTKLGDGPTVRPLSVEFPDGLPAALAGQAKIYGLVHTRQTLPIHLDVKGTTIFEYHGSLYVPSRRGYLWFRIDPETLRVEVLTADTDFRPDVCWYALSNCYGLVGGRTAVQPWPARFFRVSIEETGPQSK